MATSVPIHCYTISMNAFRNIPAVNDILASPAALALSGEFPHEMIVDAIRAELDLLRQRLRDDGEACDAEALAEKAVQRLAHENRPRLRRVINATGIVLHTNLGRAPMALAAAQAAFAAAEGYLNLELGLETGKRSSRQDAIRDWVCRLTGAESATAVNNNAAATVLALRALCQGREVVLSRGQLIEIGGSFRIPEIMAVSGAILREVGTTNITRIDDYAGALEPTTAAFMNIHTSNYRIAGFTESVSTAELVSVAKPNGVLVIDDIGSGALVDFARFGFSGEPLAKASIAAGADLVLFSGDKLLGGPQAGILAGRADLIQRIERDPLMRAFRLDKMTLAALEATLRIYLDPDRALKEIPVLRMLNTSLAELKRRADALAGNLQPVTGLSGIDVKQDVAYVGGGSLPDQSMPTIVVEIRPSAVSDAELSRRLRLGEPAVLGRMQDGKLLLDMRTVFPNQMHDLIDAIAKALAGGNVKM